jgi:hypothetical protein
MGRMIFGEPIVFFRTADGMPIAVQDRCVHRHLPLSKGKVVGAFAHPSRAASALPKLRAFIDLAREALKLG